MEAGDTPVGAAAEPLPPHNLDAEESILGAIMLPRGSALTHVLETGLQDTDFYRPSHAIIWRAALAVHQVGDPVDAITVAAKLAELGQLDRLAEPGPNGRTGQDKIQELAALVPAAANAAHYARLVIDAARRRKLVDVSWQLRTLGTIEPGTTDELEQQARDLLDQIGDRGHTAAAIDLQTHQQILETEIVAEQYLIDDLIPTGAVGTIAAVPEAHKSWLAQAIAVRVAAGTGWVLGKEVVGQTPVAYLWQDDSTTAELSRVKLFETRHPNHGELPILWGLNLGIQLPRDLARLRTTVQQNHLGLLVLDSFYNFVTADLKDDIPEQIVALLKREICDATGCTILIVDHMPWATDTNRGRLRAYGGVFKNAATRFGIYIDAVGDKLHIEARGNNISGFPRRLAYWDTDQLELKLVQEQPAEDRAASAADIADFVRENGGDVSASDTRLALEISPDTLLRRVPELADLGIEYHATRGKPGRLRTITPADSSDNGQTPIELPHELPQPQMPQCGNSPNAATEPHNHAGLRQVAANAAQPPAATTETGDLQAKRVAANAAPPTGVAPLDAAAPPEDAANDPEDPNAEWWYAT